MPWMNGIFTLFSGYKARPGDVIKSDVENATVEDIAAGMNEKRPIPLGGTGASTAEEARKNLGVPAVSDVLPITGGVVRGDLEINGHLVTHNDPVVNSNSIFHKQPSDGNLNFVDQDNTGKNRFMSCFDVATGKKVFQIYKSDGSGGAALVFSGSGIDILNINGVDIMGSVHTGDVHTRGSVHIAGGNVVHKQGLDVISAYLFKTNTNIPRAQMYYNYQANAYVIEVFSADGTQTTGYYHMFHNGSHEFAGNVNIKGSLTVNGVQVTGTVSQPYTPAPSGLHHSDHDGGSSGGTDHAGGGNNEDGGGDDD